MPPTISTDKSGYLIGESSRITGQSIPKSQMELQLFNNQPNNISLIGSVLAKETDTITTKTDENGNYSINIPTKNNNKTKVFTRTIIEDNPSSRSNILNINIYPPYMIIINYLNKLIELMKENLLNISFVIEIMIVAIFLIDRISYKKPSAKVIKKL
jgi:hypothetical protein